MSDGLLLCVPTRFELERLQALAPEALTVGPAGAWDRIEVIGFGPVAAAASAARLCAQHGSSHVVLIGIAGTFGGEAEVGTSRTFGHVRMDGVGAGEGPAFLGPDAMGFPQWEGDAGAAAVFDRCDLADSGPELLTVAAATDGTEMLSARRTRFPTAAAEDMESFGVALAAAMAGIPLTVIRGLSNVAGQRDPKTWAIDPALRAAAEELQRWRAAH